MPLHPTLGDVDSPQVLVEYQAAKRAHKGEWKAMKSGTPQARPPGDMGFAIR